MTKTCLFQDIISSLIKMIQTFSMSHSGNLMGSFSPQNEIHAVASVLFTTAVCFCNNNGI